MGLLSLINPIEGITREIIRWQREKESAQNDSKRIEAEERIEALKLRRDVVIAATQNDKPWSPRSIMGYSVSILVVKLLVWDTTFQLGVTPYPGDLVIWLVTVIVGFYFLSKSAETITTTIANRIARRK